MVCSLEIIWFKNRWQWVLGISQRERLSARQKYNIGQIIEHQS